MSELSTVVANILHAAKLLFQPDTVVEVRVPKARQKRVVAGWFNDFEKMAEVVARQIDPQKYPGAYWTLNPVDKPLLARAANKVLPYADDLTLDTDIIQRLWLPVDLDPDRKKGISSTDAEHVAALNLADRIQRELASEGWPDPIKADSGNGAHLLYAITLPNDAKSAELLRNILAALAERFNGDGVEVDRTTFNASRIFKIYGSMARKGDDTSDRPHRLARIIEVPALVTPVSPELLRILASTAKTEPSRPAPRPREQYAGSKFDLRSFLDKHGIRLHPRIPGPIAHRDGVKYILECCPFDASHKDKDAAVFEGPNGYGFKCFHSSCADRKWKDFRELYEPRRDRSYRPSQIPADAPIPALPPDLESSAETEKGRDSDELPLSAADVEAAIDATIESKDLAAAMRLIPEIARLSSQSQVLIQAKLRSKFKRDFPSADFRRSVKEWMDKYAAPPEPPDSSDEDAPSDAPDLLFYPLTDSGNGERIVALYPHTIRYCVEFKKWLVWDGRRWKRDDGDLEITQKAKSMARLLYDQAKRATTIAADLRDSLMAHARDSESHARIMAALKRAASEPGMSVAATELDLHRYLLNCMNGVVDVRTGELLESDPKYLITKLCHVKYVVNAKCNRFLKLLNWAMGEDPEDVGNDRECVTRLVDFLQKMIGYSLTGDVSEKAAFIFFGKKGNNGKTTILTALTTILAEYSTILDINTLMTSKFTDNNVRADMAKLHGARLAITSEIDDGQRLSERLLKYLTQGMGKITACRKFENPFEFDATHKIIMDANYRPEVKGGDMAIWGRLKCVDFNQRIEDEDPNIDKKLIDKLLAESEGILAWAVRGAVRWAQDGKLGVPPEVKEATAHWRDDDDPIKEFLEDCCEVEHEGDSHWVLGSELSAAYSDWAKRNTETRPLTRRKFAERLEQAGFRKNRSRRDSAGTQMRTWEGLLLKQRVTPSFSDFGGPSGE